MKKTLTIAITILLLTSAVAAQEKISPQLAAKIKSSETPIPVIVFLNQSASRQAAASLAESSRSTNSYQNLNAFAAELTPTQIKNLAQNPATEKIFPAGSKSISEKSIALSTSVDAVDARSVWALGYTGQNITVAVIDTGIDYTHPDLGNCTNISPSCRVRGGYDYYNNNADPMDTHSHGTHCAGIIGANGTLMGVAPQAKFLAYKVCNNAGTDCPDPAIISAIDASISADADVISMSLAGPLQPNDGRGAVEYALAHAAELDIVSAIAAGNHGDGSGSLEAPADAENAISVGLTNDQNTPTVADDGVVSYSCRGPVAFGRAAPDIVAPGYDIYSTVPGGTYGTKSGTSMATPHVAGAAALLLDYNGNITPAEVRKLLKQSATDLHDHPFSQGAGALNISRAITQTINASVHKWEPFALPGWNATTSITIQNRGNTTIQINFTAGNLTDLEGDHSISSSNIILPEQANLSANSTRAFNITITVPSNASAGVYGTTLVATSSGNQTIRIPIALSVPHVGGGFIQGSIDDGGTTAGGDWITIPLIPSAASSMTLTLNYTASNIHLYVYSIGGQLAGYDNDTSNPKTLTISNLTQDTYWILIHGYIVSGEQQYNLTITLTQNLTVAPSGFYGEIGGSGSSNITFTLTNDGAPKNMTPAVKSRQLHFNESIPVNDSVIPAAISDSVYYCQTIWFSADLNLSLSELKTAAASLSWDTSNNLLLEFVYLSGNETTETRYLSDENNPVSGLYVEQLPETDVSYYAKNYGDFGVWVCNRDTNQSFNGTYILNVTLHNMSAWNATTLSPAVVNLSANQSANLTVLFNLSRLTYGRAYDAVLEIPSYAQIPLHITVGGPSAPALSQPPNTTNNSQVALNWTASASTVYIIYYNLSWSQDENFGNESSLAVNDTNATLNLSDGTYYARVRATDANNLSSPWSNTVNFTVDTTPPTAPAINPLDSVIHNDSVNLTWNASTDATSGIRDYLLEISTLANFTNLTHSANTSNASALTPVLYDNLYFARVRAVDAAGNAGNWSATVNYTLATIALNEFLPNSSSGSQWIELYNIMEKNHSLAGWTLGGNSGNITLNNTIAGRGYIILYGNETGLPLNATADSLRLWNQDAVPIDNASYANLSAGYSMGRMQDGTGAFTVFNENQTTPGAANTQTLSTPLAGGWNLVSIPLNI